MDVKLKLFCTVAETKSFSRTSRIVHLSQPAVSLQIQALEEFFGTKLFDRSEGEINLTPAGKILYGHAKHILEHYIEAEKEINSLTGAIKGGITIGASTTLGNYVLPQVIIDFKKNHPKVKIKMVVGNTKRIEDLLSSGFVDVGLIEGRATKSSQKSEPLLSDELVLIVPPMHPLVQRKALSILEIVREPFIIREEGSGTRQVVEEYFELHGISMRDIHVALVLGSPESVKEAVKAGIGISIISRWAVQKELEQGKLKELLPREGRIERKFLLILPYKFQPSHAAEEFIYFLKKYPFAK